MERQVDERPLTKADVAGEKVARIYSLPRLQPTTILGHWMENPDEVLKQFGQWEGIGFYFRMLRQFAFLGGPINQRIDEVVAADRLIVPGDKNSATSVQMAADARRVWAKVRGKGLILRKLLMAMFVGYHPVEKVWDIDTETGLLAPLGLFDVPPVNVRFGPNGEEFFLAMNRPRGELIPARKVFYSRWGSMWTPYGEGELKDVYLVTWYLQQLIRFGLEAIEQLGRPIPIIYIPRGSTKEEIDEYEQAVAAQYKFYLTMPSDETRVKVEFAGANIAAGGAAGRSEMEWCRYLETHAYVRLLNTAQTQDRGGAGNGKLEEVRNDVKNLKTPSASDALDEWLNDGWMRDLSEVNWGDQPEQMWPRFESDAAEIGAGLVGVQAANATNTLLRYRAGHLTAEAATGIIASLGVPDSRAERWVQSITDSFDDLMVAPEMFAGKVAGDGSGVGVRVEEEEG
ncbi:MAG TPA: hypothetical protein VMO47_09130 [Rhodothermales bacterium]|nr:hypothetical protein [Rhodothermales bacterium]